MKEMQKGPLVYIMPIFIGLIMVIPLPLWYLGTTLSEKVKYMHLLIFTILLCISCVFFWCSRLFVQKKLLFTLLGYLTSSLTIVLGVLYGYYIYSH